MTPTQKSAKILRLLADGLSIETVALMVGVSERLVKHVKTTNHAPDNRKHLPSQRLHNS